MLLLFARLLVLVSSLKMPRSFSLLSMTNQDLTRSCKKSNMLASALETQVSKISSVIGKNMSTDEMREGMEEREKERVE